MYKHEEAIKAWLAGKRVQKIENGQWKDLVPHTACAEVPEFNTAVEHRIVPDNFTVACCLTAVVHEGKEPSLYLSMHGLPKNLLLTFDGHGVLIGAKIA